MRSANQPGLAFFEMTIARALFGDVPDGATLEVDVVDGAVQARVPSH